MATFFSHIAETVYAGLITELSRVLKQELLLDYVMRNIDLQYLFFRIAMVFALDGVPLLRYLVLQNTGISRKGFRKDRQQISFPS